MKFPITAGTASRTSFPGSDIPVGPNILPFSPRGQSQVTRASLTPSRTAAGAWQIPPNPSAGDVEFEWLNANLEHLQSVAGLWVAIKGHGVRASSDNLEEILDWLVSAQIADALVVQIPDDLASDQYVIA